jgi:hypothetical protein
VFAIIAVLISTVYVQSAFASTSLELQEPTNISNNPSNSKYQNVLVSNQNVYVAWIDGDDTVPKYNIYFKASHDNGTTFGPAKKLSSGAFNYPPLLAAFGSDVYVAWIHEPNGKAVLQFRASHDNGNSFDALINIANSTSSYSPIDIATYDNNVYLVYERFGNKGTEMALRSSHDRGVTFGEPFVYRKGQCVAAEPHVAAWKNHVYITAQDPCKDHPDLLFRASHNNGTTFSKPMYLGDESQQVKIAAKGKFVYLVWNENAAHVNFRVSSDHGKTFSPTRALEGDVDIANPTPDLALAGNHDIYVVWYANVFRESDILMHIFFTTSHDNGQSFEPLQRLDLKKYYSVNPRIAADGNNVVVVWQNISASWTPSGSEILFRRSDDKGASFGPTVVIDHDTGDSLGFVRPEVEVTRNRVFISWWHTNVLDTPEDVYLQRGLIHDG